MLRSEAGLQLDIYSNIELTANIGHDTVSGSSYKDVIIKTKNLVKNKSTIYIAVTDTNHHYSPSKAVQVKYKY